MGSKRSPFVGSRAGHTGAGKVRVYVVGSRARAARPRDRCRLRAGHADPPIRSGAAGSELRATGRQASPAIPLHTRARRSSSGSSMACSRDFSRRESKCGQ